MYRLNRAPVKQLQACCALPLDQRDDQPAVIKQAVKGAALSNVSATMRASHRLPVLTLRHLSPSQVSLPAPQSACSA
ncbi:MAG TPA: hypothetical protein PLU23_03335, partial [Anaerolineaceae bacterium]|nr:hypothetical protein [Anaerolineaceae bacterium]